MPEPMRVVEFLVFTVAATMSVALYLALFVGMVLAFFNLGGF